MRGFARDSAVMTLIALLGAAAPTATLPTAVAQTKPTEPAAAPPLSDAERQFAEQMSGATLAGNFTLGGLKPDDAASAPKPERYELGEVRKVAEGQWLMEARIRYGQHDVKLPLTLPVEWAGDTAVIVVDKIGFPGLGVYSARVLIHDGKYAGYWQGGGHGGHLFGAIEPAANADR